ncbi:hypothetical protein [Candidatus Uabimicrobium amorphum]|uniref:Protein-PII uridylyltransferase N-terminal domain-containing protein n=1 Tax=Uabimicrobium amorphum TaxID=2596890 RepID=A0A5S9ISP5_UABAM|nr:hypothetical protein [Candidatus Uabimicrobium amorphum]BBM86906.1 hypothetical protein UABAM_05308 [Candidatus Uabimicrobium amorphum]
MWGKFTVRGSESLEKKITEIMHEVVATLKPHLREEYYVALVLIGGYGRGEGGVEIQGGEERPHNNFDFLLLTKGSGNHQLKSNLDKAISPLIKKYDLGMDIGMIDYQKLKRSPRLVMWHDMYFGHKVIIGEPDCVRKLTKFARGHIIPQDIANLLVNRGTLLLINELLLQKCSTENEVIRRLIVKHVVKAIIGYGDALLFFNGAYSWSYCEKQQRMRTQDVDADFKKLYDDMLEFRFFPQYDKYLQQDLHKWLEELRPQLAKVHLYCEEKRFRRKLTWDNYLQIAFAHICGEGLLSLRSTVKKLIYMTKKKPRICLKGTIARLGYKSCSPRQILTIVFPIVAYHIQNDATLVVQNILHTQEQKLLEPYLRQWCIHGDTNFIHFLQRYDIDLGDKI